MLRSLTSSGAGHSATECTWWNVRGDGIVIGRSHGRGYAIGTGPGLQVHTATDGQGADSTARVDWVERVGAAAMLLPPSLWASQLAHQIGT